MVTVGFLIRFEAKPGKEADVERALKGALAAAQEEPGTIAYFLIRLGPSTFGVFDAFPDEERRLAHYNARWPQLQARAKACLSQDHWSWRRLISWGPSFLGRVGFDRRVLKETPVV